jgi:ABC-2 type transport system ATP-binding protein
MSVTEESPAKTAVARADAPGAALIDVSNLLVSHDSGFSLRIPQLQLLQGDMLAVLGANGSGKSTLLSCLFGTGAAFHGSVSLLGCAPGRLDLALRNRLGVQWQGAGFNELYLVREIQELHRRCYARSDAAVFAAFGVPELGKQRFGRLSSGEQQRVQLAMALAHHPKLAVFDEPTSNLDPHYEDVFCQMLKRRHGGDPGFASLCVTHSARVAALCERMLVLDKGGIDALDSLQSLVSKRFDRLGCRIVGSAAQLDAAEAAFAGSAAVRSRHRDARAVTVYGGQPLRELAQAFVAQHEVEHFSLWRPGAADLLEAIKGV